MMPIIPPSSRNPFPPTDFEVLEAVKRATLLAAHCVRVGIIQSYDAGEAGLRCPTVSVLIAQQQVTSISTDGNKTLSEYPELRGVPVVFPAGGGFTMTFPIAVGDECLLVFNDRELDNWVINGASGTIYPPTTGRLHDLSDAIAFVGLRSNPRALGNVSTTAVQIRNEDQTVFVELTPDTVKASAPHVKVHGGTSYSWDVHGYGQKTTWTGGANYTIDNYVVGAIITTNNLAIAPPESP